MKFNYFLEALKKTVTPFVLAGTMAMSTLVGCGEKQPLPTVSEYLMTDENFDFLGDSGLLIIATKTVDDQVRVSLVRKISMFDMHDIVSNSDDYSCYFDSSLATTDDTYIYFDVYDCSVVSVKYENVDSHFFKDNEVTTVYKIGEIIQEDLAFNYASCYLGIKATYSRDETDQMLQTIQEELSNKSYTK